VFIEAAVVGAAAAQPIAHQQIRNPKNAEKHQKKRFGHIFFFFIKPHNRNMMMVVNGIVVIKNCH
jgi:hypothetical protein